VGAGRPEVAGPITKGVIMAKKFFFVCGGIMMLVLAYTLGANSVVAQSGERNVVGIAVYGNDAVVVTDEGDVYQATNNNADNWTFKANVFEVVASE
jgi:hypothetical protein